MAETFFTVGEGNPRASHAYRLEGGRHDSGAGPGRFRTATPSVFSSMAPERRASWVLTPRKSRLRSRSASAQAFDGSRWEQYLTNPFANGFPVSCWNHR